MEYFWWLYLATRLDSIQNLFGWLIFFGVAGTFASLVMAGVVLDSTKNEEEYEKLMGKVRPWRRLAIGLLAFSMVAYALTPNRRDALFIAGGVGVIEGAKALQGSEIAQKSVAIVEQWLSNNLQELQAKGAAGKSAQKQSK